MNNKRMLILVSFLTGTHATASIFAFLYGNYFSGATNAIAASIWALNIYLWSEP